MNKDFRKKRERIINDLKDVITNNKTFIEKINELNQKKDYFYDYYRYDNKRLLKNGFITTDEYNDFNKLFEKAKSCKPVNKCSVKNKFHKDTNINTTKVRSLTDFIDFEGHRLGKILHYSYEFKNRFGDTITGIISREDMDEIYSLYSYEGMNQSQRQVSRHFLNKLDMDFFTFKKLLNSFNITKQSMPFSPHVLEEQTLRDCVDRTFNKKEEKYFKRIEGDRIIFLEKRIQSLISENDELKKKHKELKNDFINSIELDTNITPYYIVKSKTNKDEALFLYLSDCHVGADVSSESLYENPYNEKEFHNRLEKILDRIKTEYDIRGRFDRIVVVNLGDALDGYDAHTARKTHSLPQNLSNKNQMLVFIKEIQWFVNSLYRLNISNNIDYVSVGTSNHGGEWEWASNKILETYFTLKYPDMFVKIFEKFIDYVEYGKHTIILSHGKDDTDLKFGFPLYIDNKTELYLNEYIDNSEITNKSIYFVKGDLHQSSMCPSKRFTYKNVGSIFGGSKWIATNYGKTKAVCDYQIFNKKTNYVCDNRIILN